MTTQENAFCFIMCTNDDGYCNESLYYISRLEIPENYVVDCLTVTEAESMTSGYNEAMHSSNAKYKIYLHQDTYIVNRRFLFDILEVFQQKDIGMIGVVGCEKLPPNGIMWHEERYGMLAVSQENKSLIRNKTCAEVEAIDGLIMITQYDLEWREDLFDGWHLYDVSQSLEFRKKNYKVVVPVQNSAWCIHDCGVVCMKGYEKYRLLLLDEYADVFKGRENKRVLYIPTEEIKELDIPMGLYQLGYRVLTYYRDIPMQKYSELYVCELEYYIQRSNFIAIVTHDFSTIIAEAAHRVGVKYIAWSWDAPLHTLYSEQALYDTNHVFMFDKKEYQCLKELGIPNIYYKPLASDVVYSNALIITPEDEKKYSTDISMVAGLYDTNMYDKLKTGLEPEEIALIDSLYDDILRSWGDLDRFHGKLSDELIDKFVKVNNFDVRSETKMSNRYFYETMLLRSFAHKERVHYLNRLAQRFDVTLYTGSDTSELINVRVNPRVDYKDEMPRVFHLSKINLNLTLRTIQTGIPLRVFDIMSVGGFVLSNYQAEMDELFVPDLDLVYFKSEEELLDKAAYYLKHEKERIRIAMNGYLKVKEKYNYTKTLQEMMVEAGV